MRVVLDTNTLASGFLASAHAETAPASLLRTWRAARFTLVVSPQILTEFVRTLAKPSFRARLSAVDAAAAADLLQAEAMLVEPTVTVQGVATHSEDDGILALAVSAQADVLVTGDLQLLKLGTFAGVTILSPRTFADAIEPPLD